jgi:hypothetical protein
LGYPLWAYHVRIVAGPSSSGATRQGVFLQPLQALVAQMGEQRLAVGIDPNSPRWAPVKDSAIPSSKKTALGPMLLPPPR